MSKLKWKPEPNTLQGWSDIIKGKGTQKSSVPFQNPEWEKHVADMQTGSICPVMPFIPAIKRAVSDDETHDAIARCAKRAGEAGLERMKERLAADAALPRVTLRLVKVAEDDGTETEWVLIGHQDAVGDDGRWYTRLLLMRGEETRQDITMTPLEYGACLSAPGHWPYAQFTLTQRDVQDLPAAPAYPLYFRTE